MCIHIGLVGAPASGKDEVAKFLVEKHGFSRLAFADEIKKSYFASIGITEEDFKASRNTEQEKKWRSGLWDHSKEICQKNGPFAFIEPIIRKITESPTPIVISDIRTNLEFNAMKEIGASIILIVRNFREDLIIDRNEMEYYHIKETKGIGIIPLLGLPLLHNNGTLEDLYIKIDLLYNNLEEFNEFARI